MEKAVAGRRGLLSAEGANGEMNFKGRTDISGDAGAVLPSVPFSEAISVKGL